MVYQGATGLYHFVINVIPFISNSVVYYIYVAHLTMYTVYGVHYTVYTVYTVCIYT